MPIHPLQKWKDEEDLPPTYQEISQMGLQSTMLHCQVPGKKCEEVSPGESSNGTQGEESQQKEHQS